MVNNLKKFNEAARSSIDRISQPERVDDVEVAVGFSNHAIMRMAVL